MWLSSDREMMWYVFPFLSYGGGDVDCTSVLSGRWAPCFLVDTFSRCVHVVCVTCCLCGGILCSRKVRFALELYIHTLNCSTHLLNVSTKKHGAHLPDKTLVQPTPPNMEQKREYILHHFFIRRLPHATQCHPTQFCTHLNKPGQNSAHCTSTMCTRFIRLDYRWSRSHHHPILSTLYNS
jgi:hypothetical protein